MTIAEICQKYWPEGCPYFERGPNYTHTPPMENAPLFMPDSYYNLDDDHDDDEWTVDENRHLNVIAAVAVAWFEHMSDRKIETFFGTSSEYLQYVQRMKDAAAAWRSVIKWEAD